ncbi:MAG: FtsX-like permease family protein [Bacteroidales bacterium]|nr:FtsX-like permease family protein [Bacteroidales bacterium]
MSVSFFVAKRYLWARKSHHLVQLISRISLASIAVCTAALFIVLSVFNGLQAYIGSRFNTFHADIEITARKGKTFPFTDAQRLRIAQTAGVEYVSGVCCDLAVLTCEDRQFIARLKGVETDYYRMKRLDTTLYAGRFVLESGDCPLAVIGSGVERRLRCGISEYLSNHLSVYYPKRSQRWSAAQPMQGLNSARLTPIGGFATRTEYDESYVFVPLSFMQELTAHEGEVTSVEIRLAPRFPAQKAIAELQKQWGPDFVLKDLYQQEAEMYKVMRSEKWAIFAILSFILLIASFNMIGMMALLVLDKKKDMGIFYAMGAETSLIRKIFIQEGLLITGIGACTGVLIGSLCCALQQHFQLIRFGEGLAYPVEVHGSDILGIFAVALLLTLPAMTVPVVRISERLFKNIRHE